MRRKNRAVSLRRAVLETMSHSAYKPLTAEELASLLGESDLHALQDVLAEMEAEGAVIRTRKKHYGLPDQMGLVTGRLQGNPRGFAFLLPDREGQPDVFVPADGLNGAMHRDRVVVRLARGEENGSRPEGEVIRILERANLRLVGRFEYGRRLSFVRPDELRIGQDVLVPAEEDGGAHAGDKVVVEITRWSEPHRNPEGRIVEVLGAVGKPGVDILSIIRKHNLPEDFPRGAWREAEEVPAEVGERDLEDRRDLRHLRMVTIDGEDAKDLDDAVSLERGPGGGYVLGVHIADVGYYVPEGSELDKEALRRGTSVYLVDRVLPMLPPRLSNGICSLNAQVDRLAMTALIRLDARGEVLGHELFPSVIRVRERMTYTAVRRILEEDDQELAQRYAEHVEDFRQMAELAETLSRRRTARGSVDFDFPEVKVLLDEEGRPAELAMRPRSVAERIIEEFMVLANEVVAKAMQEAGVPFVYRVHEGPDPDGLHDLNEFLHTLGYHVKASPRGVRPQAYQDVLRRVAGRAEERMVATMLLRSMKHARYDASCLGHFGLAANFYCHFTSPIRRYPDLVIHRIIRETLQKGRITGRRQAKMVELTRLWAQQSSEREKTAEEAERESVDLKKVEYMAGFLGQQFPGVISGVTSYGFYVELPSTVEGLVHVSTLLDDYYSFQEKQLCLVGRHTRRTFRLGDPVRITVTRADSLSRQVDLELATE